MTTTEPLDLGRLRAAAYRAGCSPPHKGGDDEQTIDAAADEIATLRERLALSQQSDRAMAMRAERAERERDEERQNAAVEAKLGDEARANLAQLRALHRDTIRAALPDGFTVREDGSPVDWVLALAHAYDEARVEVERLRSDLAAIWTTCTGIVSTAAEGPDADNIPRRVEELRALALQPMDGPPTEPGWYVMLDEDDRREVVQVYGPPGTTLCVDHGGWGWHTVDAAPTGNLWLARIPVEALEVSDGE